MRQLNIGFFAKLINDISSVENVVLTMELPINVSWSNRSNVPVGDPLVLTQFRAVSWKVSKFALKPGNIGFAFEVALLPSANPGRAVPNFNSRYKKYLT